MPQASTYPKRTLASVLGVTAAGLVGLTDLGSGIGKIPVFTNFQGSGLPALILESRLIFARATTGPTDFTDIHIRRAANYTGGTNGIVNSALYVATTAGAGAAAFEWNASFELINNSVAADGSENIAIGGKATKTSTGRTLVQYNQIIDAGGANPTTTSVVTEYNLYCNGGDSNFSRILLDLRSRNTRVDQGGDASPGTVSYGVRAKSDDTSVISYGFVGGVGVQTIFYGMSTTAGGTLMADAGSRAKGIDLTAATYSGSPFAVTGFSIDNTGSASGKAFIPNSTTVPVNGLYLGLANQPAIAANSAVVARFAQTNGGLIVVGAVNNNPNDMLAIGQNVGALRSVSLINASGTNGAAAGFILGNGTSATQASLQLNGNNTTSGNGANSLTLSNGADIFLAPTGKVKMLAPIQWAPAASVVLSVNGTLEPEYTSNTSVTWKLRGSDGTTRTSVQNFS